MNAIVSKLIKTLKGLTIIIRNPYELTILLNQNHQWEKFCRKKRYTPLKKINFKSLFPNENSFKINTYTFRMGGSLPTDIALLSYTAKNIPDCHYFEIGTWMGESSINVAPYTKTCYTLNLSDEEIRALGLPEDYIRLIGYFSKNNNAIHHIKSNSAYFNYKSLKQKFDLIFIDGDHHFNAIKTDTKNILTHLVHDKTIIIWHDYAYEPGTVRYEVLAAIRESIPFHLQNRLYYVENTKCAILYPEMLQATEHNEFDIPDTVFEVQMTPYPINKL